MKVKNIPFYQNDNGCMYVVYLINSKISFAYSARTRATCSAADLTAAEKFCSVVLQKTVFSSHILTHLTIVVVVLALPPM